MLNQNKQTVVGTDMLHWKRALIATVVTSSQTLLLMPPANATNIATGIGWNFAAENMNHTLVFTQTTKSMARQVIFIRILILF